MTKMKHCDKCGHNYPARAPYFHKSAKYRNRGDKDGLSKYCADCMNGYLDIVEQPNLAAYKANRVSDRLCGSCGETKAYNKFTDRKNGEIVHVCDDCVARAGGRNKVTYKVMWPTPLKARWEAAQQQKELFDTGKSGREYDKRFLLREGVTATLTLHIGDDKTFTEKDALRLGQKVAIYALEVLNEE